MQQEQITSQRDFVEHSLRKAASEAQSRLELWARIIQSLEVRRMAEIGVYRGDFSAGILDACGSLNRYYMLDPWRHLSDWNKPANESDKVFEEFFEEAKSKTDFAASKRVILRGKTTEVMDQIPDGELDLAYIDADHTLRGIAIDLIRVYPKVRPGGYIGGDDFTRSIWEHTTQFEPTLVFPFAVYFAEAVGARIYALPFAQFCMQKADSPQFSFTDLTGHYNDTNLRDQFATQKVFKQAVRERFPSLMRIATKARNLFAR